MARAFPRAQWIKNWPANAGDTRDMGSIPGWGRSVGVGKGDPVFLPGKSHGQRSLVGYSPWDPKESDVIERLTLSLSMPKYLLHQNDGTDFRILTGLQMWYMVSYLC